MIKYKLYCGTLLMELRGLLHIFYILIDQVVVELNLDELV